MEVNQTPREPSHPMNEVRTLHLTVGPSIQAIIEPTYRIFIPHLLKVKEQIQAIPYTTKSYGSHPRQKLDIYQLVGDAATTPILIFLYGGGLIQGDKILPFVPEGLIYHNVGTFFANRGITTIIPDYRRVNSVFGGEKAKYPSGGEDVSLVLKWLEGSELTKGGTRNVFILGASAGGVHLSTFMLEPMFLEQRRGFMNGDKGLLWKGAVGLGVPFHFKAVAEPIHDVFKEYYGSQDNLEKHSPYGLFQALVKAGVSRQEAAVPKILALLSEYDPEVDIVKPAKDFVELSKQNWGEGIELVTIEGHNHISPTPALMGGDEKAQKWGEDVVKWILEQC